MPKPNSQNGNLTKIAFDLTRSKDNEKKVRTFKDQVKNLPPKMQEDPRIGQLLAEAEKPQFGNFFKWLSMIAQRQELPPVKALKE